jgi:hypothetical protein
MAATTLSLHTHTAGFIKSSVILLALFDCDLFKEEKKKRRKEEKKKRRKERVPLRATFRRDPTELPSSQSYLNF